MGEKRAQASRPFIAFERVVIMYPANTMIPENIAAADREGITILNARLRHANNHVTAKTEMYGKISFRGEKIIDSAFSTPNHSPSHPNPMINVRLIKKATNRPQNICALLIG